MSGDVPVMMFFEIGLGLTKPTAAPPPQSS